MGKISQISAAIPIFFLFFFQFGCGSNYERAVDGFGGKTKITVDLSNTELTDDDLAGIDFPVALRELSLENTGITDRGVEHLEQLENLEFVNLNNTQVTNATLELLKNFPNLRSASVTTDNVGVKEYQDFLKFMGGKNGAITNPDELPMILTAPPQR